jgi:hypothetical protein
MRSAHEESNSPQPFDQTGGECSLNPESFGLHHFGGLEQLVLLGGMEPRSSEAGVNPNCRSLDKSES